MTSGWWDEYESPFAGGRKREKHGEAKFFKNNEVSTSTSSVIIVNRTEISPSCKLILVELYRAARPRLRLPLLLSILTHNC